MIHTRADEHEYLADLARILRAARLNALYPDARRLAEHASILGLHGGLYSGLEIEPRSGLPSYKEWVRAKADHTLATTSRASTEERQRYYLAISGLKLAELGGTRVALKRSDPDRQQASFQVVFDKLDQRGCFIRYTIDLSERGAMFAKPLVSVDASCDVAEHSEELESVIYRLAGLDAELTWAQLVGLGKVSVERLVKATVGPIFGARFAPDTPELVRGALLDRADFVATFSLVRLDPEIAADRERDPLARVLEAPPPPSAVRERLGYRVARERKFVVPSARRAALVEALKTAGAECVVYGC